RWAFQVNYWNFPPQSRTGVGSAVASVLAGSWRLPPNARLLRLADDRLGVRLQQVTLRLQAPGVVRDLLHVVGVAREGAGQIHDPTADRPNDAEQRVVVVSKIDREVLVLADGDLRQTVAGRVHGLATNVSDQGVAFGVAVDLVVLRRPEPEARR